MGIGSQCGQEVEAVTKDTLIALHDRSFRNLATVRASELCGCFYCQGIYPSSEVVEFVRRDETAVCPKCGIDSVLGDAGAELTPEMLSAMHEYWFSRDADDE